MGKKKMFLVIDTETCNFINSPYTYDIGYAITDKEGNIALERSFVVGEIFLGCIGLMKTCYYSKKIPQYWKDIESGKRQLASLIDIAERIHVDMENYNVSTVCAYNINFDIKALNNTIRFITHDEIKYFFHNKPKYECIWNMACETIMTKIQYIQFAMENSLISDKGTVRTSAEACFQWLTQNPVFEESHTGLEDVYIEIEIMRNCYKSHKKLTKEPNSLCWRKVDKVKQKYIEKQQRKKG